MNNRSTLQNRLSAGSFLFPHRIHRIEYLVRGTVLGVLMGISSTLMNYTDNVVVSLVSAILTLALMIISFWIYLIPRVRDVGWNTKLAWLILIPGVNVFMGIGLLFLPPK